MDLLELGDFPGGVHDHKLNVYLTISRKTVMTYYMTSVMKQVLMRQKKSSVHGLVLLHYITQ